MRLGGDGFTGSGKTALGVDLGRARGPRADKDHRSVLAIAMLGCDSVWHMIRNGDRISARQQVLELAPDP
jgi:hypothetical protein